MEELDCNSCIKLRKIPNIKTLKGLNCGETNINEIPETLEYLKNFRKKHKNTFTKSGRIYSKEKINFKIGKFLEAWKAKNAKRMKEMHVVGFEIVKV